MRNKKESKPKLHYDSKHSSYQESSRESCRCPMTGADALASQSSIRSEGYSSNDVRSSSSASSVGGQQRIIRKMMVSSSSRAANRQSKFPLSALIHHNHSQRQRHRQHQHHTQTSFSRGPLLMCLLGALALAAPLVSADGSSNEGPPSAELRLLAARTNDEGEFFSISFFTFHLQARARARVRKRVSIN